MAKKYDQVVRFVQETPWAVRPEMLLTIRDIVASHLAGVEREPVAAVKRPQVQTGDSVAVLPLWGVIVPHAGLMSNMSGGTALDSWIQDFRALVADPSVGTIILDVDSPGGAAAMVPEAAAEIRAATARKKIIAVANPSIGSAAYWLASQADEVVAPASGMVGSVGVIAEHTDFSKMEEMEGITRTFITAGDYKAEQLGPLSDEAKAEIQDKVDQMYEMFVAGVAKGRGVTANQVMETYGKGRMLTAKDALAVGMVDRIGTLDSVLAKEIPGGKRRALGAEEETAQVEATQPLMLPAGASESTDFSNAYVTWSHSWVSPVATTSDSANTILFDIAETGGEHAEDKAHLETDVNDSQENEGSASRGALNQFPKEGTKMDGEKRLTLDELAARKEEVLARMAEIHNDAFGRQFSDEEQVEFDELDTERETIESAVANIEERVSRLLVANGDKKRTVGGDGAKKPKRANRGGVYTGVGANLPENIFDVSSYRGYGTTLEEMNGLYREGAMRAVEGMTFEANSDKAKAESENLLGRDGDSVFAKRILTTGSPLYDRAFGKTVMGKPLTSQEDAAIKAAVSETGLGSTLPVPVTIDPTVILTSDGAVNPLRQIARTVTITGNTWQGISSDGVTVAYQAELTEVGDQTPGYDAPTATVAKAHGYCEFSIEVDQDWGELRSNLRLMFQDAKDMKEATAFLYGSGTNEPEGLLYALDADAGSYVDTATINTFDVADIYSLKTALPPRFRSGASFLANDMLYSLTRQFDEAGGSSLWAQLAADRPALLLGKPIYEASEITGDPTTGGDDIMVYGDFGRGFIIVDRVGINVELIPLVMGSGRRPNGSRALYVYFRNTSALLTANAFRVLRVKAS